MTEPNSEDGLVAQLLGPWEGPCGGIPPFDQLTPEAIEQAYGVAAERTRDAVGAIAANPGPPDVDNTVVALEEARRPLRLVHGVFDVFARTRNVGAMREVEQRLAAVLPAVEDEIVGNGELWSRVDTVWSSRDEAGLSGERRRLVEVVHEWFVRRGAGLDREESARMAAINARSPGGTPCT